MSFKNGLLILDERDTLQSLECLLAQARAMGVDEITAVAAGGVTPPGHGVPAGPGLMLLREREIRDAFRRLHEEVAAHTRGVSLDWRAEVNADPTGFVLDQAARSDLMILARHQGGPQHLDLGRLIVAAGRPVLSLPAAFEPTPFVRTAIGYRRTRESRLAIAAALPALRRSSLVLVIGIGDECSQSDLADVVAHLASQGVHARSRHQTGRAPTAAALTEAARDEGAQLLVSGAYGHSRSQEWLFGGITQDLLSNSPLPWLTIH